MSDVHVEHLDVLLYRLVQNKHLFYGYTVAYLFVEVINETKWIHKRGVRGESFTRIKSGVHSLDSKKREYVNADNDNNKCYSTVATHNEFRISPPIWKAFVALAPDSYFRMRMNFTMFTSDASKDGQNA